MAFEFNPRMDAKPGITEHLNPPSIVVIETAMAAAESCGALELGTDRWKFSEVTSARNTSCAIRRNTYRKARLRRFGAVIIRQMTKNE